jgi:sec-independent protein translocase protein TatB
MFDIAFTELMIIAVVALIVIGPERLPKVARTLGHLFGRMQRYVNDVKADISREMQLEELKKLQTSMQEAARSFEDSVTREVNSTESELQRIAHEANPLPSPPGETAPGTTTVSTDATTGDLAPAQPPSNVETELRPAAIAPASQAEAPRPALGVPAEPLDRRA